MKKIIISASLVVSTCVGLKAQQIEQFSMYMENNYLINPAEAGTTDYIDSKVSYRNQWGKMDGGGAPTTYYVSAHSPIGHRKNHHEFEDEVVPLPYHGIGFAVIQDEVYSFSRTNFKLSYSYQKPLSRKFTVSAGIHAGIQQCMCNSSKIQNVRDRSQVFGASDVETNNILPDLSVGFWGHTHNFYFGLASFQLIPSKLNVEYNEDGKAEGTLKAHHWFTTGVRIPLDSADHFNFVPSLVFKATSVSTIQVDLNAKIHYRDHAWVGFSYRNKDAFVGIVGVTIKKQFDIAYSYDWTFNNIRQIQRINSHEILLGMRIANHPHEMAPPPFW